MELMSRFLTPRKSGGHGLPKRLSRLAAKALAEAEQDKADREAAEEESNISWRAKEPAILVKTKRLMRTFRTEDKDKILMGFRLDE